MLKWLWQFIKPYRKRLIIAMIALLVTAMLGLSLGQAVRLLMDEGFSANSKSGLADILGIFVAVVFALSMGAYLRFYMVSWLGERVVADIRKKLYRHMLSLSPSFFEDNLSGEIQSRLTTDTALLQTVVGSSFSLALRNSLTFIGGLTLMFVSNVKLSLIVLVVVPLIVFPLIYFGRKVKALSRQSQDKIAAIGVKAGESLQHIKIVQAFTRESLVEGQFNEAAENAFDVALLRIKQRALLIALVMMLVMSAIAGMLYVGGSDVLEGRMSPGELGAFVFYAIMVASSLATVTEVYGEVQRAAGAVERIRELLMTKADISSGNKIDFAIASTDSKDSGVVSAEGAYLKNAEDSSFDSAGGSEGAGKETALLSFNQVNYAYPSRPDTKAIDSLTLDILPGERLALVGPSGAGKSTLFDLLLRFRDPQSGSISIAGEKLKGLNLTSLRSQFALVPQQPILFSTTVWENLRYGSPDATEEEVIAAAKAAHADEFIAQLPDGYHSFLGENGVKLSGGQKQRLAIARAILRDPKILLLDEATSALDAQSEFLVQQALDELMKDRTTLIIAHRLATVAHVDRIAVFDQGCLADIGTHQTLLDSSPLYKRLAELQFDVESASKKTLFSR